MIIIKFKNYTDYSLNTPPFPTIYTYKYFSNIPEPMYIGFQFHLITLLYDLTFLAHLWLHQSLEYYNYINYTCTCKEQI